MSDESEYQRAAAEIAGAEALLIGAGAGMGVDSGLPDFRGNEGFWKAYPPFRGKIFAEMSNPIWFRSDVDQAWGFFGHRLNLYRNTQPHDGFAILRRWADLMPGGAFVFTSNVDGHFQLAGFEESQVLECHGSIRWLQCANPSSSQCMHDVWPTPLEAITVDEETIRAAPPHPNCPHCDRVARPNILMFGDYDWIDTRTQAQAEALEVWLDRTSGLRRAVIEIGAGKAIPTVRRFCERHAHRLIRINPREPEGSRCISIPAGGLEALQAIDAIMFNRRDAEKDDERSPPNSDGAT